MSADYREVKEVIITRGGPYNSQHDRVEVKYDTVRDFESGYLGPQTPQIDPVVESVREDLLRRSQLGLSKYGVPLSRTDLSMRDFYNHLYEELLDGANYLKRIMMEMDNELGDK